VNYVFDRAEAFHRQGKNKEILTVDNAADSVLLLQRVQRRQPWRWHEVKRMLEWNGGNQSGVAVASVDPTGGVHVDQFSWKHSLGNVRDRPFGEIWQDESEPRLAALRARPRPIKGRCSGCSFRAVCNGNLRARAESYFGDFLAPDPACYLTDAEIGLTGDSASEWRVPVQET
jgi:radical SAM protein with 4Fe4S-binding SPASM domain